MGPHTAASEKKETTEEKSESLRLDQAMDNLALQTEVSPTEAETTEQENKRKLLRKPAKISLRSPILERYEMQRLKNTIKFLRHMSLDPIALDPPPEQPIMKIRQLGDIMNASTGKLRAFLRAYGLSDSGNLTTLRVHTAIAAGVPDDSAQDIFGYVEDDLVND
jgi:hypothetical protein